MYTQQLRMLRLPEVTAKVGLKRTAIYAGIAAGRFPRPVQVGPRAVAWIESELESYLAKRIAERDKAHTAEA